MIRLGSHRAKPWSLIRTHSDVDHGIDGEPVLAALADHLGAVSDTRKEASGED